MPGFRYAGQGTRQAGVLFEEVAQFPEGAPQGTAKIATVKAALAVGMVMSAEGLKTDQARQIGLGDLVMCICAPR